MGFGKKKHRVREAIASWDCFGFFGYGQGRAVAQFGEAEMCKKSACMDICTRANACRTKHHEVTSGRFPHLTVLVEKAARISEVRKLDVVAEVVSTMEHAAEMGLPEALHVKDILASFKVDQMTDHYRCGQFENIQDGLNRSAPGTLAGRDSATRKAS